MSGKTVAIEYDFGKNIGNTDIVKVSEKDAVFYAKRAKHDSFAPFVRRRAPLPSTFISVVLKLDAEGEYELRDAWFGQLAPPLPGAEDETDESKGYWQQHALVFEGQAVQMRTLTRTCPY